MNSQDLTSDQLDRLVDQLAKHMGYYKALRRRMDALDYPKDDPLYELTASADDAANRLWSKAFSLLMKADRRSAPGKR